MVFFALTKSGFDELVALIGRAPSPVWVNFGVLSKSEIAKLRESGVDLTDFSSDIAFNPTDLDSALDTIWQHHPGSTLWVGHSA